MAEGDLGCPSPEFVALHLQRGEVEKTRWRLSPFLLLHGGDGERLLPDCFKQLRRLGLRLETSAGGIERGAAVEGLQFPEIFGTEVGDLEMALHHKRKGGGLHAADREHGARPAVFQRIQPGGVHT